MTKIYFDIPCNLYAIVALLIKNPNCSIFPIYFDPLTMKFHSYNVLIHFRFDYNFLGLSLICQVVFNTHLYIKAILKM